MSGEYRKDEVLPTVDLGYPTGLHGRIPSFNNIEEEAEFWDTHDFTDFWEESRPANVVIDPSLRKQRRLTVRLDEADEQEIERRAKSLGVGSSTLVRMWIKERLNQERKAS
jgi:predicted DNA binding CopG/RHH family protein